MITMTVNLNFPIINSKSLYEILGIPYQESTLDRFISTQRLI